MHVQPHLAMLAPLLGFYAVCFYVPLVFLFIGVYRGVRRASARIGKGVTNVGVGVVGSLIGTFVLAPIGISVVIAIAMILPEIPAPVAQAFALVTATCAMIAIGLMFAVGWCLGFAARLMNHGGAVSSAADSKFK